MDEYKPLSSEEDIRTKVVTAWLAGHGFGPSDISVEYSFEIRLGRKILPVVSERPKKTSSQVFRPRADVLVRNRDGKNLLIVEVKAPDEPLDGDVREQGICYARLLRKGGIAPFVVLTNGHETKIYDSITEELLNGSTVPIDHPHIKAGFRVSADDIAIRAEAIETFISLSSDNLIMFCQQQVAYRMRFLRDDDPYSGKKYIPSLYVEREEAKGNLERLLDEEKRRVVLVDGLPQVGKTNFICRTVEERLEQGLPCLFYPAIGMGKGLLEAICEDFEWILGDSSSPYQIIQQKLQRILRQIGQKLIIFVDGWNEANLALARTIDQQSERLAHYHIACVISMTSIAASRLLKDEVGNPSHIAQAAGITASVIPLIEISPERQNESWSRVTIGKYSSEEMLEAYYKYSTTFRVTVPGLGNKSEGRGFRLHSNAHEYVEDPFLLRIGMEQFHDQVLPQFLDEPNLLQKSIELKAYRAVDLEKDCVLDLLTEIADEMFDQDVPVRRNAVMKRWGKPISDELPKGLFEAALLAKVQDKNGLPALDFYYGRERDFAIAYWARNWISKLNGTQEEVINEISLTGKTLVGFESLRWFLKQPVHRNQLKRIAEFFPLYERPSIRRVILSSIREIVEIFNWNAQYNLVWIQDIINKGAKDSDLLVRVETIKLIALFTEEQENVASVIDYDEEFISKLLEIEEEYSFDEGGVGFIVRDAFHHIHWGNGGTDSEHSQISKIIEKLLDHNLHFVRLAAAKILGCIAPDIFLSKLSERIMSSTDTVPKQRGDEYIGGVELAVEQYGERYYGSMCPGYLEVLKEEPEQLYEEYTEISKICTPIIKFYPKEEFSQRLVNLLEALKPDQDILMALEDSDAEDKGVVAQRNALRYQLPLPFNDFE